MSFAKKESTYGCLCWVFFVCRGSLSTSPQIIVRSTWVPLWTRLACKVGISFSMAPFYTLKFEAFISRNERDSMNNSMCTCQVNVYSNSLSGYDMSTFIRRYAKYLNEKAISYRGMAFDFCKVKRG